MAVVEVFPCLLSSIACNLDIAYACGIEVDGDGALGIAQGRNGNVECQHAVLRMVHLIGDGDVVAGHR